MGRVENLSVCLGFPRFMCVGSDGTASSAVRWLAVFHYLRLAKFSQPSVFCLSAERSVCLFKLEWVKWNFHLSWLSNQRTIPSELRPSIWFHMQCGVGSIQEDPLTLKFASIPFVFRQYLLPFTMPPQSLSQIIATSKSVFFTIKISGRLRNLVESY